MKSLFKSDTGKASILQLYKQKLNNLSIDYKSTYIDTSFGNTHILVTGDAKNPPLIIVHGSNGCAPIGLETYPNLSQKFQVFAIDVLAQPNRSEGNLLSMKNDDYGKWMQEIIRHLGISDVTMAGFSLGGLIILKSLEYDASNIREVFLAAPAYIVNGNPLKALWKMFIPMKRYIRSKNQKYIRKFLTELFSAEDEFALNYLSEVFLHFKMDFTPVPTIKKSAAQKITTPITLFAAGDDLLFPGKKMLKRAKRIFPSLKEAILLDESKHVQNRVDNTLIESYILALC